MSERVQIGEQWKRIGADLGIRVQAPFKLALSRGVTIKVCALVPDFGGKRGMLVIESHRKLEPYLEEIEKLGYGWSENRVVARYDPENFRLILRDWTWTGSPERRPAWVTPLG